MGSTITIDFHGDPLLVIETEGGPLVPLRPLVKGMGLDWSAQRRRVYRNPIMAEAVAVMATTPNDPDGLCLPLDLVPGFLFTVNAERVDEAVRAKVLDYQRECFRVLADACLGRARPAQAAEILPPAPIASPDPRVCLRLVTECRHTFGLQPARELWFHLGLPRTAAMVAGPRQGEMQFTYRREA